MLTTPVCGSTAKPSFTKILMKKKRKNTTKGTAFTTMDFLARCAIASFSMELRKYILANTRDKKNTANPNDRLINAKRWESAL